MNLRVVPALVVLASLPFFCAIGQTGWTLEQCVAVAKERSPALKSAHNLARTSDLSQQELATTKYPQVKLGALAIYAPAANHFGYDPAISNGGEYAAQLFVQQSVYDGGVRGLRTAQMQVDMEQRRTDIRRSERDIVFAVRQGYVDVLRAQRESELERESVRQLEEYLELIKRLAKGGTASSTDVMKTEVQIANARLDLQRTEEQVGISMIALEETIGLPPDTAFVLAGALQALSNSVMDSLAAIHIERPDSNLDLLRSKMEIAKSLIDVDVTRHELFPTVSLIADAGMVSSGENLRLPQDEREPILGFSVGVTVELPLLNWGATDLRVQQKQIASENLRLEHEQLLRTVNAQARTLRLQFANVLQRVRASRQIIEQADGNFLLTKAKYATGSALSLEVLAAQQLLIESKRVETQALVDVQNILAHIDQLLTR
jgi:outer membrane protein TolC